VIGMSFNPTFVADDREGEFGDQDEMGDHKEDTNDKALETSKNRRWFLGWLVRRVLMRMRMALMTMVTLVSLFLKDFPINTLGVILIFKSWSSKKASEAKDVTKEFQWIWQTFNCILLSNFVNFRLGSFKFLTVMEDLLTISCAIVEIVSKGSEFHRQDHLCSGEVKDSRHVGNIHSIDVTEGHEGHSPNKDADTKIFPRENQA
jgi:hypothetical protein